MIDSSIPPSVVNAVQSLHQVVSAEPMQGGFSGASVFRCESETLGTLALRRWPSSVAQKRVAEVHRVQAMAHQTGCKFVPRLLPIGSADQTLLRCRDACWEVAIWVPGTILPPDASIELIAAGAKAIGEFHRSVVHLGSTIQPAACFENRLRRVSELNRLLPVALESGRISHGGVLGSALLRSQQILRQNWSSVAMEISRSINRYAARSYTSQYVLRDVHREHILFTHDQVSGLIDFDAIRPDMPLTDLVRWAGSFMGSYDSELEKDNIWKAVLAGYGVNPTFPEGETNQQIQIAKLLHKSAVWISLANWLVWMVAENRAFPSQDQQIAGRLDGLITQVT